VLFARQHAASRPINIHRIKSEELPLVRHDTGQIHQVILNLLLNAIQALDGVGNITVKVEESEGMACVSVEDTGPGIPPQTLSHIFRPFFTTKGHGTGLGLSLAKRIIEDHNGSIEVTSTLGQGSKFTILLPFAAIKPVTETEHENVVQ